MSLVSLLQSWHDSPIKAGNALSDMALPDASKLDRETEPSSQGTVEETRPMPLKTAARGTEFGINKLG
jgi:hypothetical protein